MNEHQSHHFMSVNEVFANGKDYLDRVVQIEGPVFLHGYRCWLVPDNAPDDLSSQEQGILIKQPGLSFGLTSDWLRAGGPIASVDHVQLIGTLVSSPIQPFSYMLERLSYAVVLEDGEKHEIRLDNITEISASEKKEAAEGAEFYGDPKFEAALLDKYRRSRSSW